MTEQGSKIVQVKPVRPARRVSHPKAPFSFRRNVMPPLLGVLVMLGVIGLIHGQWLSAQLYYHFGHPDSVDTLPVHQLQLDPQAPPEISIPAISVKAPVIFEPSYEESQVQLALRRGVVKFATTANPGQNGNVVIFGHSSGQPWGPGDYKFVFTMLEKLKARDKVYIDYQGQRYIYQVTNSQVVLPTDVGVLNPTDKPTLTLITCTPVGTSQKRLVVRAEQISPKLDNTGAQAAGLPPEPVRPQVQPVQPEALPNGDQTSVWDSIRGLF